ncbi:MAG: hypothetical protein KF880_08355 [Ferruginibacter sp.]|nr:hypothetical protein [Ferruginibacter sp.]
MRYVICLAWMIILWSCNGKTSVPDVSRIDVKLTTERFEKSLFSMDTVHIMEGINSLNQKHPSFTNIYLARILNADPRWGEDTTREYIASFLRFYKPVYDTAQQVFPDFKPQEKELKRSLQFLKYHFPEYKAPEKVITYIGPLDGYGDILDEDAFLVGLHHHLGSSYSLYESMLVQETYPTYISRRFTPQTIVVNCMSNVLEDMYPDQLEDKTLIVQMVEKGKKLYALQQLIPEKEEHLLIGYTKTQMKECYENEKTIWSLFTQNNYLQSTDFNINKNFVGESPRTMELGEASPGNIGAFTGWQIVKKYISNKGNIPLNELMSTPAETIYTVSKYKP